MSKTTQNPQLKNQAKKAALIGTNELPYDLVSAFRLKRSKPSQSDQLVSFLLNSEDFKRVSLIGINYGVTFDEVIKGLLDREFADVNGGSTLSHFIPVLNV